MVQFVAHKPKNIRWRVVAVLSAVICVVVIATGALWPQPPQPPMPARVVEPPPPWEPTSSLEESNDLLVLQAVLARECSSVEYSVLASKPDEPAGLRSRGGPTSFPAGLECPGVKIVDSAELDELFSRPDRHKAGFMQQGGWGNFHEAYPKASGIIYLSLPAYGSATSAVVKLGRTGCFRCGAGWEFRLAKVRGKWVVQAERPSWIA